MVAYADGMSKPEGGSKDFFAIADMTNCARTILPLICNGHPDFHRNSHYPFDRTHNMPVMINP